jgi:hypothetical protein
MGGLGILQQSIQLSTTNAALNAVCTKTLDKITAEACLHSTALMGMPTPMTGCSSKSASRGWPWHPVAAGSSST